MNLRSEGARFALVILVLLLVSAPVLGATYQFEDFEDGLDGWTESSGSWSITSTSYEGTQAVESTSFGYLRSNGTANYTDVNATFRVYLEPDATSRFRLGDDGTDYYRATVDQAGTVEFGGVSDGGVTDNTTTATVPADEWLLGEIRWRSDDVQFILKDQAGNTITTLTEPRENVGTGQITLIDLSGTVRFDDITTETRNRDATISNATPSAGSLQTESSVELSADVADEDFDIGATDTVYFLDGTGATISSTTVTENRTVTANWSGANAGSNNWSVVVNEPASGNTSFGPFSFEYPQNLTIKNESDTQLLDNLSEPVTLRFYYENGSTAEVVERQTSNGIASLSGLPVDRSFVVVADAPGYLPRRIFVSSLLEQQSIYLLPSSAQHVENLLTLQDYSGDYAPDETVLIIQRSINGSWETVQGDYFGATGEYSAQLAYNVRHRMILRNTRTGDQKVVGPYTPISDGTKNIKVTREGDIELVLDAPRVLFDPSVGSVSAVSNTQLVVTVDNQSSELRSWSVEVIYRNQTAQETLFLTNETSPEGGTISPALDLSERAGGNVTVLVNYTTEDGQTGQRSETFIVRETFANQYSLLSVLGNIGTMIPSPNLSIFTTFIAIIVSVLAATGVASAFRASTELVGVTVVGTLAFFSIINWIGVPIVFVSGMSLIAFAALRRGL
ncbi:hypothetical protein [Haloferax sp. Atlit-12N]|uniref:hypothetical protein n=1 Tax=Haloferax sp. Atlit-12N TaxID=2077203 RepID=UPI0011E5B92D|nr:hypothetical protein [Haloferax sp. Atlit-12N]